jgi:TonB family protein
MTSTSFLLRLGGVLTFVCLSAIPSVLHAQSTEAEIKSRLIDRPLYLRGCWNNDKLHFDSTGKVIDNLGHVTFTLCGFEFGSVHLKQDKLVIDGYRVGLELAHDKIKRVRLVAGDYSHYDPEEMHLEINAPANGDYSEALNAILVDGLDGMAPTLPYYWQRYARTYLAQTTPTPAPVASQSNPLKRIGGGVTAPVLIESKEPEFTESARALKYGGNALINFWVHPDGSVSHVAIIHALGIGLDENALAAVQRYRFKPAMENGKPVLVEVNVEVSFKIFQPLR